MACECCTKRFQASSCIANNKDRITSPKTASPLKFWLFKNIIYIKF